MDPSTSRKGNSNGPGEQRAVHGYLFSKPIPALVLEKWEKDTRTGFTGLSGDCEESNPSLLLVVGDTREEKE